MAGKEPNLIAEEVHWLQLSCTAHIYHPSNAKSALCLYEESNSLKLLKRCELSL